MLRDHRICDIREKLDRARWGTSAWCEPVEATQAVLQVPPVRPWHQDGCSQRRVVRVLAILAEWYREKSRPDVGKRVPHVIAVPLSGQPSECRPDPGDA